MCNLCYLRKPRIDAFLREQKIQQQKCYIQWYFQFCRVCEEFELENLSISIKKNSQIKKISERGLNSQPTDYQPGIITIKLESPLREGDTEKLSIVFTHARLVLVEFN